MYPQLANGQPGWCRNGHPKGMRWAGSTPQILHRSRLLKKSALPVSCDTLASYLATDTPQDNSFCQQLQPPLDFGVQNAGMSAVFCLSLVDGQAFPCHPPRANLVHVLQTCLVAVYGRPL